MSLPFDADEQKQWTKLNDKYYVNLKKQIGTGAYGRVYLGYSTDKKCIIAVKVVKKNIISSRQIETLRSLSSLDHPNIMGFYGDLQKGQDAYLFLQYCGKGTLADWILKGISELDALRLFREMVEGMCYMNAKKKMHRDFKPQNILIGKELDIKICDFGLSQTTNSIFVTGRMGTPLYAAPEVFLVQNSGKEGYSWNCDVWSCGFILYQMLMKERLFYDVKDYQELKREWLAYERGSKQAKVHEYYHPLWNYFINYMIQFDPIKRPTFHLVLQQLKKVYNSMQKCIKTKSNMMEDLNLKQVSLYINYNMSKYQILLDVCEGFTQQDIPIHNQFKYACMFMCLVRFTEFAKKFIRSLKYRQLIVQGVQLRKDTEEVQVEMFYDLYRFLLEHRLAFYMNQLKKNIVQKIQNCYCKRDQSKQIMEDLKVIVELTKKITNNQVFQQNQNLCLAFKSILAPITKRRDYKKFTPNQLRLFTLLLTSMLLEQKFPTKDYCKINVSEQILKIYSSSKAELKQSIQKMYCEICK